MTVVQRVANRAMCRLAEQLPLFANALQARVTWQCLPGWGAGPRPHLPASRKRGHPFQLIILTGTGDGTVLVAFHQEVMDF